MNLRNWEQTARLFGGDLRRNGGVLTYRLADGDELVSAMPPIDTTSDSVVKGDEDKEPRLRRYVESDPIGVVVHRVLHSLGSYSQDKLRVEQDGRFTQAGRDAELLERKKLQAVNTADASQRIINYGNSLLEREAALFAVPPLSPHDAVGALLDREARDYARGLSGPDRAAMLQQLSRGESERMTLALLRSPVPLGNEERVAQQAWRTAVERANPDAVEQLAAETEQLRWAQLLMQRAAAKLKEKIGMSGYDLYATVAAFTPAMPSGPSIFGFRPDEMRAYRARWNALKAKAA